MEGSKSSHLTATSFCGARKSWGNMRKRWGDCSSCTGVGTNSVQWNNCPWCHLLSSLQILVWRMTSKEIGQHVAPLCEIMRNQHRLKTPTNFKRSWRIISLPSGSSATAAAPCQTAWAFKAQWSCQLHTNHQRPASLQFGGAMAFKSHRHPAVPICYNDNVTYNHATLKWPTIATKQYNMGGSNELLSRTIMKNNCNYANPNQISKDISWYIHIYIYIIYTSMISFAAELWRMLEPSGRGLTAIR